MAHSPLTAADVTTLADVVRLVDAKSKVKWANDDDSEVRYGTARHFVASETDFNFGTGDLRDRWVRITTDMGFETALSVAWLMEHPGYFVAA